MWNFRVVRKKCQKIKSVNRGFFYSIHEAYYDDKGRVWSITQDPVAARGDSKCEVVADLKRMLKDVLKSPVLDYDKVPEKGARAPGGMRKHK